MRSFGFFCAKWRIVGVNNKGNIDRCGEGSDETFYLFYDSEELEWRFCNLQASERG